MQSIDMSPQHYHANHDGLHQRRRRANNNAHTSGEKEYTPSKARGVVKKLDLFPKTERDYEIRTERGARMTLMGYLLIVVLVMAEVWEWKGLNAQRLEGIVVDTRLVASYICMIRECIP